jgi:hypothetical protein
VGVPDLSKNPLARNNVFMNLAVAMTHVPEPLLYCIYGLIMLLLSTLMRRLQPAKVETANDSYSLPVRIRSRRVVSIDRRKAETALALREASNF